MNKKLFLSALASTALLASCVENDLGSNEDLSANSNGDGRIGFNYKVGNMTRATELAQNAGHYEFGVVAFKGDTKGAAATSVMDNYLVAFGSTTNIYKTLKDQASTWGDNAGGDYTDVENKVSSWFYEGIGKGTAGDDLSFGNIGYTVPDNNQVLKYWDKDKNVHDFYAYMPYASKTVVAGMNPTQVTYSSNALTYTDISAFSTSTAKDLDQASGYQISSARAVKDATASQTKLPNVTGDAFNTELLNYNEGLYAATSVAKSAYEKDVELTFKHINAKVNIAFYEDIKGYNVELIDLVPESTPGPASSTLTAAKGVQFSPATIEQAEQTMNDKQPTNLPTYINKGTVVVGNLNQTTSETMSITGTPTDNNLIFEATNKPGTVPGSGATRNFIGNSRASMTSSATTMYVLPYQFNGACITPANTDHYVYYKGTTPANTADNVHVADQTGYTLHVSFKMIPQDGSTDITIYDARVHVAASYCKWEAGKAYTYIFKITDRANGVTDPTTVDPKGTTPNEPWVDPTDPRVPEDPILSPIVFDGVTVTNYDDVNTGKENDIDEWVVTDPDTWLFFMNSTVKTYYNTSGVVGKDAVTDILKRFDIATSPITDVQWDGSNFNVDLADGTDDNTVDFKPSSYTKDVRTFGTWKTDLTAANVTFAGGTATEVQAALADATEITISKPTFNVWSSSTQAVPYVTVPTAIVLTPYDVVYKVTGTDVTDGTKTYETGKIITKAQYDAVKGHNAAQTSQITVSAKFKPTVTYQTATNITAGPAATANSAYLIVTKKLP